MTPARHSEPRVAVPWWEWTGTAGLAALVALGVWLSLPPTFIVYTDDFGYVRSVLETLQHGRPWTNDWLEPWAASLSVLAAGVLKITGSFEAATYGMQAVLAGVLVFWLTRHLRARGVAWRSATAWSLAGLLVPTVAWKLGEFGPMPLYWVCLLGAVWAVEKQQWWLFGICWLVAVSSRQSALIWLALPVGQWCVLARTGQMSWRQASVRTAMAAALGVAVYLALARSMNPTHARQVMMPDILENFGLPVFWRHLALGFGLYVIGGGVGAFALGTGSKEGVLSSRWRRHRFGWSDVLAVIAVGGVGVLWWADARTLLEFEHPYWREGSGAWVFHSLLAIAVAGWIGFRVRLTWPCLLAALALAALIGLRGVLWEYYAVEIALLGFLGVRLHDAEMEAITPRGRRVLRWLGAGVLIVLLGFELATAKAIKLLLDHNHGVTLVVERARRAGLIGAGDLAVAPFGFQGWHLYPHYVANEGAKGGYIANFIKYLKPDALRVVIDGTREPLPSLANARLREGEILLLSADAPWNWTELRRFNLVRSPQMKPAEWPLPEAGVKTEDFPLSDEEWRRLIESPR